MCVLMYVHVFVCATLSCSLLIRGITIRKVIMTTYVQPLAMFLTTDEVCNLFNMLLSNYKKANLDSPNLFIVKRIRPVFNNSHENSKANN